MSFVKGQAGLGRKVGSKNKVPYSSKHAVQGLIERLGADVELIEKVLKAGLEAKPPASFPYLRLIVEQNIGAPDQSLTIDLARKVIDEIHPGPGKVE